MSSSLELPVRENEAGNFSFKPPDSEVQNQTTRMRSLELLEPRIPDYLTFLFRLFPLQWSWSSSHLWSIRRSLHPKSKHPIERSGSSAGRMVSLIKQLAKIGWIHKNSSNLINFLFSLYFLFPFFIPFLSNIRSLSISSSLVISRSRMGFVHLPVRRHSVAAVR